MPTIAVDIAGRVQGVGFRAFVQQTASSIGITGEVWNTKEGTVSLIATNSEQTLLDSFVEELSNGPGRVESIATRTIADRSSLAFHIGATR